MVAMQLRADEANKWRYDDSDRPNTVIEAFGEVMSARLLTLAHVNKVDLLPLLWTNIVGTFSQLSNKRWMEQQDR